MTPTEIKELLELAALAAGYLVDFESDVNGHYQKFESQGDEEGDWWNPIKNSGDALELAVRMEIDITFHARKQYTKAVATLEDGEVVIVKREHYGENKLAAVCSAITKAASEIGRRMRYD